ncbi:MAG: hypothetical protein Phog2KO_19400 [Phototrophicaceae bacterium]
MIIVDWGNYEETLIVLRMVDIWDYGEFQVASKKIHQMLASIPNDVDLMIDIRPSNNVSAMMVRLLNREIKHREHNLRHIIAISTPVQTRMLTLASEFYPSITHDIQIMESVDHAYQYLTVSA